MTNFERKVELFEHLVNITDESINDVTFDMNANKGGERNRKMATVFDEVFCEEQYLLWRNYLSNFVNDFDYHWQNVEDGILYFHDKTKMQPYCCSFEFTRLIYEKTNYGNLITRPAKRLDTYISIITDSVSEFCRELAGAIGIGSFFIDAGTILVTRQGYTYEQIKNDKEIRDYIRNSFQRFIFSVNHLSRATESAFTNISVFDESLIPTILDLIITPRELLDDDVFDEVCKVIAEIQKIFIEYFDKGKEENGGEPYTFPIVTVNIADPESELFNYISTMQYDRYNLFLSKGAKFAMCCRLANNLEIMEELGGYANSFAASPANIGSHRVVTINFNRLALMADGDKDKYYQLLNTYTDSAVELLRGHKAMLYHLNNQKLLPLVKEGWINMSRMFSTIGVLGLVEAARTLKDENLITETLEKLNDLAISKSLETNLVINIEEVPGEQARFKLCAKDKEVFGEDLVPYQFYANQFAPLTEDFSIWEKIDFEASVYEKFTGGGIAHLRMDSRLSPKQFKEIVNYAWSKNLGHIAVSSTYSKCINGHTTLGNHTICPNCGSEVIDYVERIVGYFRSISNWGTNSKELDFFNRKYLS